MYLFLFWHKKISEKLRMFIVAVVVVVNVYEKCNLIALVDALKKMEFHKKHKIHTEKRDRANEEIKNRITEYVAGSF